MSNILNLRGCVKWRGALGVFAFHAVVYCQNGGGKGGNGDQNGGNGGEETANYEHKIVDAMNDNRGQKTENRLNGAFREQGDSGTGAEAARSVQ